MAIALYGTLRILFCMCTQHSNPLSRRNFLSYSAAALGVASGQAHSALIDLRDVRTRFDGLGAKNVVLTLDACSGAPHVALMEFLVAQRIDCSIFVTGSYAATSPQSVARFFELGWDVLNHGEQHHVAIASPGRLWNVPCTGSIEGLRREVENGASQLAAFREHSPRIYRGATAMYDARTLAWLDANNWIIGGWSVAADAGGSSNKSLVQKVVREVRAGDVLLAHINHPERDNGVYVMETLQALQAKGISFMSWKRAQKTGVRVQTVIPRSMAFEHA